VSVKKLAPNTPKDLCVICEKAMVKNPTERYQSVIDFVEDLKRWQKGLSIKARPAGLLEKYWMWTRRYPLASILSLLLIGTIITSSILFVSNYKKRGELLFESLVERAKSERLAKQPSFRGKAIDLLYTAKEIKTSKKIQQEVVAVLGHWDIISYKDGASFVESFTAERPPLYEMEEISGELVLTNHLNGQVKRISLGGVLRCPAVCSADGKLLAFVRGEDIEVVIYDLERDFVYSIIPIESWPVSTNFSSSGNEIKVVFEDEQASLYSLKGDILLKNFHSGDDLTRPVGVSLWKGNFIHSRQAQPYGAECSPDKKHLATTSALGVHIWNCKTGEAVDFYETSNQRIDSPTDAWWLDDQRLLVQIPGAQEIIEINSSGEIVRKINHERVPGSIIRDILPSGDWKVEVRDEDDRSMMELWKGGDSQNTSKWQPRSAEEEVAHQNGVISYNEWKLTIPSDNEILKTIVVAEKEKIIALTNDYSIFYSFVVFMVFITQLNLC